MKKKKKLTAIVIIASLAAAIAGYIIWGNSAIVVTELTVTDSEIPAGFDGYRIAQISDLHCSEFGKDNAVLLKKLAAANPDIIVITGDLIDYRRGDESIGIDFAKRAAAIAPTYFVSGNHENDRKNYATIAKQLRAVGVTVLRNECVTLTEGDESITLIGMDDPVFMRSSQTPSTIKAADSTLKKLGPVVSGYSILLAHRPEFIELYASHNFDLVFSGHAHGGQFILPFIGGLYAPGQGALPTYTEGLHTSSGTDMIVSRGLGNSGFPFRFNNRPEIVVATLKCEN